MSTGSSISPRNPNELKLDVSLVSGRKQRERVSRSASAMKSPSAKTGAVRKPPSADDVDHIAMQLKSRMRGLGISLKLPADIPAMALFAAKIVREKFIGSAWTNLRKLTFMRITDSIIQKDLIQKSTLTAEQTKAVKSILEHVLPEVTEASQTANVISSFKAEAVTRTISTENAIALSRARSKMGGQRMPSIRSKSSDSLTPENSVNSPLISPTNSIKRSQRHHRSARHAKEEQKEAKKGVSRLQVTAKDRTMSLGGGGQKNVMMGDFAKGGEFQVTDKSSEGSLELGGIYDGLQHNPYVGSIRHAPDTRDQDITEKVYQTAMGCSWMPLKNPQVADIIPLSARILQLVSFEAASDRYGAVDEEEIALLVMHRLVEDTIPWQNEDDKYKAVSLMQRAVPEAITARLTLSTIEAIVALSEKQTVRRKLEENVPYMAVMGLDSRIQWEGFSAEVLHKRKLDNLILTVDLLYSTMVSLIPQFLMGYNTAVLNSPAAVVFPGHSKLSWSLAVSVFAIGGPFGALTGGIFANVYGRKRALVFDAMVFLVGGLLLTFAPGMITIIVSRIVIGFASGFATVLVPVYIGELAPPALRGTFGTMAQLAMVSGILAASLVSLWFTTPSGWRILFGVTPALALCTLPSLNSAKESPRWLFSHGKMEDQKRRLQTAKLLMELRGFRTEQEVAQELQIFEDAIKRQKTGHKSAHALGAMFELLVDGELRRLIVCTLVLQMGQQFCGINAVFYYSTSFLTGAVSDPLLGSTIVAFINVIATYGAAKIMDKFPRKVLLISSALGMFLACIGITIALDKDLVDLPGGEETYSTIALLSTGLYVTMFELGLGPIPWLISSEMFDVKNVATAQSIASQMNWICNFLVGMGFPYLQSALGGLTFVPFAMVLLFFTAFVFFYVPETRGRNSEEVLEMTMTASERRERKKKLHDTMLSSGESLGDVGPANKLGRPYGSFGELKRRTSSRLKIRKQESFADIFIPEKCD